MTKELSPVARAVLQAVTLKKYDVPPEGLPGFALEMAPLIASALRGLVGSNAYEVTGGDEGWYSLVVDVDDIYAAADELDALTAEQLVRASDLVAWADHMEQQMEQLDD